MTDKSPTENPKYLMKLSREQCEKLQTDICREIDASEAAKGTLPQRWQVNEDIYHVAPGVTNLNLIDGMEAYNIPLWRPKADRIKGSCKATLTGTYPYVQAISGEPQGSNVAAVERGLMNILEQSQIDKKISKAIIDALNMNLGIYRVRPIPVGGGMKVAIDHVHPRNMCCYPSHFGTFDEAKTIGHRFWKLMYRVKGQMEADEYYKQPDLTGGDDPRATENSNWSTLDRTRSDTIIKQEDSYVELWEVIHECDLEGNGEYKKYLCVVAKRQRLLLSCQEYPYPTIWYVDWRTQSDGDRIWPNDSVAQTVQGPQKAYSDIHTTKIQGSYQACFPPVVMSGGTPMGKAKRYGPAQIWETTEDVRVTVIPITFNPGSLDAESEEMKECVDSLTGINRLGTGENLPASTKATAIDALMSSMAEAKDNYTDELSPSLEKTFALVYMFVVLHFAEFKEFYGNRLPIESPEELPEDIRFEATGKSTASSPQQQLAKYQVAREIAMTPMSDYDLNKVDEQVMQMLDFPFDVQSLKKDAMTAIRMLVEQAMQLGIPPEEIAVQIQMMMQQRLQEAALAQALSGTGEGAGVLPQSDVGAPPGSPQGNGGGLEGQGNIGGLGGGMAATVGAR